jgi:hypothetical protein
MALLDFYGETPAYLGGLLGEDELNRLKAQAQSQSNLGMATALLQAGAPSRTPGGGALAIAQGLQAGQDLYRKTLNQGLQEKMAGLQVQDMIRKRQEDEAVRKFLPQIVQPGAVEQNWSGAPEQVGQYFQTGAIPTQQGQATINRDALQRLIFAAPEQFAKYYPGLKAMQPEYKFEGGVAYQIDPLGGGIKQVGGQQKLPAAVEEYKFAVDQGYKGTFQDFELQKRRAGATVVDMSGGQKGFTNLMDLKKAFGNEPIYKDLSGMQSAYGQVIAGIDQKTPIGDIAGATKIMKLLDPGSVVRETELGMAMQATGKMDLLQNYFDNWKAGTKLTDKQRVEFKQLANELYNAAAQGYNEKRKEYSTLGASFGLDTGTALGPEAKLMSIMNGGYDPYKKYGLTPRP